MEKIAKIIGTEGNFCCFSPYFNNNFLLCENIAHELNIFYKGNRVSKLKSGFKAIFNYYFRK